MKNSIKRFFAKIFAPTVLLCGIAMGGNAQTTTYTPGSYTTVVPAGVTTMQVTATGAAGGSFGAAAGGKGGSVTATYTVVPGTTYYIFVGDKAANTSGSNGGSSYGGGEDGGKGGTGGSSTGVGGGAGSDVRTSIAGGASGTTSLNSRIVVGGGGGGVGAQGCTGNSAGGNGGYPTGTTGATGGCTSCTAAGGGGGTQSAGGARGSSASCSSAQAGTFGNGGNGGVTTSGVPPAGGTGAGGGGWYGGGGCYSGGGGGGSSYASSTNIIGTATFNNGTNTGDGEVIICFSPSAITGPSTVCPGQTIALTDITPGGSWSSSNTNAATVEPTTGIVHGLAGGTTNISYSTGTCPAIQVVTVTNLPAITGNTSVCIGSTTNLSNTTSGGVWSSDNSAVATVVSGVVNGGSVGTANISYTVGSCAVGVAVTVSGAVSAITGPTAVCGGATIGLTDATTGGVWSSSNTNIATISNLGVVTGIATGTTNISYASGACITGVAVTVTAVGPVTGPTTTVCAGSSILLTDATPGGAWSSDNTAAATVSGPSVTGVAAGTANISYTVGACASFVLVTVTAPLPAITGPTSVCTGSTIVLSNATTGGVWSSSNTSNATVNPGSGQVSGVATGTTNISYTVGGCSVGTTITVGVLPAITGPSSVCAGATMTLSDATTGGTWSSDNTAIATVDPVTGLVTGVASGSVNISYTNGTCSVGKAITVGPLPAITGTTSICPASTSQLSDATPGGVWSSDNTLVATVSATGLVTGVSAGGANISYTTGPCSVGVMVMVGVLPGISGPTTVCPGGTMTLSDATTGGTWSSSNTGLATVDPVSGVVTGVTAGAVNISYTSGGCSVGYAITVGALSSIAGPTTLCVGTTITLSHATTGGVWSSGNTNTATVDPVSGVVTGVAAGGVNITYNVGSCNVNVALTVNAALSPISGPTAVCTASTITLSNATGGGVWSSDNSAVATVGLTGVVSGVTNGTANISYTVGTCAVGVAVTVNTLPAITGPTNVCAGSSITLSDAAPGGVWSSANPSAAGVSAAGVVTGVASGSANIIYTVGSCTVSQLINVGSVIAVISGSSTVCTGATTALSDATLGGAWSSDNTTVAGISGSGVVSGVTTGTANISYTIGSCSATHTMTVEANSAGTISGPDSVCKGPAHQVTLTSTVPGGVWSSSNTARATVDPATGVVTGSTQTGTVTIKYVISNSCGTFTVTHTMYVRTPSKCATGIDPAPGIDNGGLSIIPNPNNGTFNAKVLSDIDEDVHIVVTNIVGEKVKELVSTTNKNVEIRLDYAPGIYLISASTAHERYVTKIVVQ